MAVSPPPRRRIPAPAPPPHRPSSPPPPNATAPHAASRPLPRTHTHPVLNHVIPTASFPPQPCHPHHLIPPQPLRPLRLTPPLISYDRTSFAHRLQPSALITRRALSQDEDKDTGEEIHEGSVVRFFINGKDQGKAFDNVQAGIYYPAASVYMGGQVTYNFGPYFSCPMPDKPDGCVGGAGGGAELVGATGLLAAVPLMPSLCWGRCALHLRMDRFDQSPCLVTYRTVPLTLSLYLPFSGPVDPLRIAHHRITVRAMSELVDLQVEMERV
jgi:hypothetical protein